MGYFFPKTNYSIFIASMTLAILSTAADAYVAYDTASDFNFIFLMYLLPVLTVMNNFIFGSFALTNLYQDISMEAIEKFGSDDLKLAVNVTQAYEFGSNIVNQINMTDFNDNGQVLLNDNSEKKYLL